MEEACARSALASPRRSIESPHSWPTSFNEELDRLALALGHAARVGEESEEDDVLGWGLAAADGKAHDEEADVLLDDGDGGCEAEFPGFAPPPPPAHLMEAGQPLRATVRSASTKSVTFGAPTSGAREPLLRSAPASRTPSRCWVELGHSGASTAGRAGGTSDLQTLFNSVNALCGIGLLATPLALAEMGWLALVLMLGLGGLFCLTGLLLGRCMAGAPWVRSYPDIGERAFGGRGRVGVAVMLYAELYLTAVDLLILAGDNLAAIAPGFQPFGPGFGAQRAWTAVAAGLVLPSVWLRGLGALAWLSALGVVVSLGLTGLVAWEGAQLGFPFRRPPALRGGGALLALGLISFNFSGHALFPSLISAMRCRAEYPRVLGATFALVIAIYVAFATLGYAAFGDAAMCAPDQNITLNMQAAAPAALPTRLAVWVAVLAPFTKFALILTPIATALEELLPGGGAAKRGWAAAARALGMRTALVASALAVAVALPFFAYLMAFVGSLLAMTSCVTVPALCYLAIRAGEPLRPAERAGIWAVAALGVALAAAGTADAVLQISGELGAR